VSRSSAPRRAAAPLRDITLRRLSRGVEVPRYDRRRLRPAVVHLGVGGFHRAHQAVYLDDLAQRGVSHDWGVTGVNLRRAVIRDALACQDGLYTVLERSEAGELPRVVGTLRRALYAPAQRRAVLDALADPRTRLVTLTITGDGYATGADGSAAAFVVEALARRRAADVAPFTVLSCDNIPDSGAVARASVLACAQSRDELLARWIETNVAFPASMVDRITPETTPDDASTSRTPTGSPTAARSSPKASASGSSRTRSARSAARRSSASACSSCPT
jgi:mannitol 2-dehydrogenase